MERLISNSTAMSELCAQVRRVAPSDANILLVGETGSGKDLASREIHDLSPRRRQPFFKITCAAYAPQLIESELFGHERGAYTGAEQSQPGRFELARDGTIYLDDVDDVPATVQVRLLRAIEERVIERVGGTHPMSVRARMIASTKVDLASAVRRGEFRADLYYRLNVVQLRVPPLRERREDIIPLCTHFLGDAYPEPISRRSRALLESYHWPGNVRELRNLTERWKLLGQGSVARFEAMVEAVTRTPFDPRGLDGCASFRDAIRSFERRLIADALRRTHGNKAGAARLLHLKPSTFRNKMARLHLAVDAETLEPVSAAHN